MTKTIKDWQAEVHQLARDKGWWEEHDDHGHLDIDTRDVMSFLANAHGEISEANEEVRRVPVYLLGLVRMEGEKPCGFGIEVADAIIRLLDTAAALGIDIEEMIERKHAYNKTRSHRHGGKLA